MKPHHLPQITPYISRRGFLRRGALGIAGFAVGPLVSACNGLAKPTVTNSRMVSTKNNRTIRILEMGQKDGTPILYHHGTPMSRLLFDPWVEDAVSHGIRLIGYDRPGYGDSASDPGRTVASAADDVAAIAKALGLKRLLMVGVSGGGPHALACAALLPDLVAAAAVLASPAPYTADGLDWFSGMSKDNVSEFNAALKGGDTLRSFVSSSVTYFEGIAPEAFYLDMKRSQPEPDASLYTEDFSNFLLKSMQEALKKGSDGWVDDDLAFLSPWGFEPSQIRVPMLIMQNEEDQLVPILQGKWLAGQIKNVESRFSPKGGHLPMLLRVPEANTWLLSKWK